LLKYFSSLGGILAGHGNISVTRPNNEVFFNKCESHVDVVGDFYVFNPVVGSQLTGIVNKVNPGQIGCLTHGLFNISLPKPFAVPIPSWLGSSVNIHDEILFTIIKVDFGSHVPYIQGTIEEVRPRVADPAIIDASSCKQEDEVEIEEITPGNNSPEDPQTSMVEEAMSKTSPDSGTIVLNNISNSIPQHSTVPSSTSIEKKKRKRLSEDPIGITPRNKRTKSESTEPADDDDDENHLVVNLFAQVSESILSTPVSVDQKGKKKKQDKNLSSKNQAKSSEIPGEECLITATTTPKNHTDLTTNLNKSEKTSTKGGKRSNNDKSKLDESTHLNGPESSAPLFSVEKRSASTTVGAFVVEKINRSAVSSSKKLSKSVNMEDGNKTDSLETPKSTPKSSKKKKNNDKVEEIELLIKEETNDDLLDASETPKSVSKSSKKKKAKTPKESDEGGNIETEENESIIKELLGSALCQSPVKTTPKVKSQKISRKSLSAVAESISAKKQKDSAPENSNVNLQIMKIMQQVQDKDKTKRLKKRSL